MTSCLNVWDLISILKGWGRQGRNPKTHAKLLCPSQSQDFSLQSLVWGEGYA